MGNTRDKPSQEKNSYIEKHKALSFGTSSMCGWRPFMEDAHLAIYPFCGDNDLGLFAVFDGHGGIFENNAGPEVSQFAKENFAKCLSSNAHFKNHEYQKALTQAFLQIDQLMLTKTGQSELMRIRQENYNKNNGNIYDGESMAGSTANVVLITKHHIYCANAGDSRSIAGVRVQKSKLDVKQLSYDHKPLLQGERRRIQHAGGVVSRDGRINNSLNLSRAFGDFSLKKNKQLPVHEQMVIAVPSIVKVSRNEVQFIMMGCDGVWERKDTFKMLKYIAKKNEVHKGNLVGILENLLDDEVGSGPNDELGMDNMTAILITFNLAHEQHHTQHEKHHKK